MKQEVNLYLPIFRQRRAIFSTVAMVQLSAVFLSGLLAIYLFGVYQGRVLDRQLAGLEAKAAAEAASLERLRERYPTPTRSRILERELAQLERERRQKAQLVELLSEDELGNSHGFSPYLSGLARQRIDGLWLTLVHLEDGGRQVGLRGVAVRDPLVPRFIARLSGIEAFLGTEFSEVRLWRAEAGDQQVQFSIRTAALQWTEQAP